MGGGHYSDLTRFDGKCLVHYTQADGYGGDTWTHGILCDRDGVVWIGTDNGVWRYDPNTFANFTRHDGLPRDQIECLKRANDGKVWIVKASPTFEIVRTIEMKEPIYASPATANGALFLRTTKQLYCIGG